MGKSITLDAGALIAGEKNTAEFARLWNELADDEDDVTVPAVALAQAWRGGPHSARMSLLLKGCKIDEGFGEDFAKATGKLLGVSKTTDVADAAILLGAAARGDEVWTSDPKDLKHLAQYVGKPVKVVKL